MENKSLDSWNGFIGTEYLKANDLKDNQVFVCVDVQMDNENDRPVLILESDGDTKHFSLNVTNSNFLRENNVNTPREVIGKRISFRKTKAYSPKEKKEVDTLRINKIEQ